MGTVDIFKVVDQYLEEHYPGRVNVPLGEEEIFNILASLGEEGPWAVYPNPMRNDGVFLCVEREIEPYSSVRDMDGKPQYPATPPGPCWPVQFSPEMAVRLLERLNVKES